MAILLFLQSSCEVMMVVMRHEGMNSKRIVHMNEE
jgi:hypothetical protein